MCPRVDSPVLIHARTTLGRARTEFLAALPRIAPADAAPLEAQLSRLEQALADLEASSDAQLPALWSSFFVRYDRLLAALRAFEQPRAGEF